MKLYHGSPHHGIEKFEIRKSHRTSLNEGEGIYLVDNPKIARDYAGSEGAIYEVALRSGALVFDATSKEEFNRCLKMAMQEAGSAIRINPEAARMLKKQIEGIIEGRWSVTRFSKSVRDILLNVDGVVVDDPNEESLQTALDVIDAYMEEHPIIKYKDSSIGEGKSLVYVVRDPNLIRVQKETPVQVQD